MSLFGSSPPDRASADEPSSRTAVMATNPALDVNRSRASLFDDEPAMTKSTSSALFADDDNNPNYTGGSGSGRDSGAHSPWLDTGLGIPAPKSSRTKADLVRGLLPAGVADVPESYIETFEQVAERGTVTAGGVARTLAAARLGADEQARIMGLVVSPPSAKGASGEDGPGIRLGRSEFNVLLALVGLAQEGEEISLDGVDERKRNLPQPKLPGLAVENIRPTESTSPSLPVLPNLGELAAKPPQRPSTPPQLQARAIAKKPSMEYPDDPWNSPDVHKGHNHGPEPPERNGASDTPGVSNGNSNGAGVYGVEHDAGLHGRTTSTFTVNAGPGGESQPGSLRQSAASNPSGWTYFDGNPSSAGDNGFNDNMNNPNSPFANNNGRDSRRDPTDQTITPGGLAGSRTIGGSGRTGTALEENIVVSLMPEKEGMFMFQHHNYEVASARRGSKVIRRYSDFVWLLDCLHKRYPFRTLPLLPPKRVAVNGNHLSNDGAFIEKRRRGLARFLNALVRHPVLGQEQLVIMFLTVPTELAVWRKQATISVQDEFAARALPPGLEDSLPPTLEELFDRTRAGVRRSAELYIAVCNVMDRLVKRSEGVAADHARIAMSLTSLIESNADTYATDTNDVPLLNDGMQAMSKHLRTAQSLMEDEARAWDEGVLEDLKRQRDALVSLRDLFDRRERLDRDNIPYLERRIQTNEGKLAALRAKPDGMVKPGEIEKVVESIIKDKESIVTQHNRSIFVKETLRDELVAFQSTQYHVSRWNQDWAQERVKYAEMLADNWRRLLDELDGMPLGDD